MKNDEEIQLLKNEIASLKDNLEHVHKRIAELERTKGSRGQSKASVSIPERTAKQSKNMELKLGQLFNRLGVVAVILGLAIFLKYSFDNEWIGPTGRVIIGILAGLAMWGGGEFTKKKYPGYAQGLLGGGTLAIFSAIYAGYSFYDLFSQITAFVVLVLIMILTVAMSVRHNSRTIGILGIIGGYTTPFLVGSNDPSPWFLFSYLAILTFGVLGIATYRKWRVFNYLSFIFNQIVLLFWFGSGQASAYLTPTLLFLAIIFGLYVVINSIYNIRNKKISTTGEVILTSLNAFLFFYWSKEVISTTVMADYLGFYAVLIACGYIFLGKTSHRIYREDKKQILALFAVSLVLITIAMPLQFQEHYLACAWLAESTAVFMLGIKLNNRKLRYSGLAILGLGLLVVAEEMFWGMGNKTFFFNYETGVMIIAIVATAVICSLYANLAQEKIKGFEKKVRAVFQGLLFFEIFIFLLVQNEHFFYRKEFDFFLSPEQLSLSGLWMLYAIILFALGLKKRSKFLRYTSLSLIGIIICKAFLIDLAALAALYKIILFIILGLCLLGISWVYQKKKEIILQQYRQEAE